MSDSGKLHVIEAVLVGALFFTSAGFVLTFDQASTPDGEASDELQTRGGDSMDTISDRPLDDPRYKDNLMSKRLAESLGGDTDALSDQLNETLPSHTLYNLYLSNGYATRPVYEQFDPGNESTTTSTRLIEPGWTYVWTATDFDSYPADPSITAAKMGLYTLPVSDATAIRTGGADVDVVVEGEQDSSIHQTSTFRLDTSFTVRQADDGSIPHASLYFNDSSDDPMGYRDAASEIEAGSDTTWYNVTLEETEGEPVEEGARVNVTLPRAWTADATDEAGDYSIVHTKDDADTPGSLVFELERDVRDETLNLAFNATYEGDEYEFYTFRASLDEPVFGDARLVVRADDQSGYTGGDFPHPRVSAPRSMGTSGNGTWIVSFPNPENSVGTNDLEVDKITIEQPGGTDLFGDATTVRSPDASCGNPGWNVGSDKLVWDPDPSDDCSISPGDGFQLVVEVQGDASYATDLDLTPPLHPDAAFGNDHQETVDRAFADGFHRRFVPPDTQGITGLTDYPGYPHPGTLETVDTDTVYGTDILKGGTSYDTADLDTFQSALALGGVDADPRTPIGESATVDIQLESLLLALSEAGLEASVETNVYPPWSMGPKDPLHTVDHVEKTIIEATVEWLFLDDLDGDGYDDVLAVTPQTKLYGIDGEAGEKISGMQVNVPDETASTATQYDYNATTTAYAIGFEDGSVRVYDEDLDHLWTATVANATVEDLDASYDWNADGVTDIAISSVDEFAFVDGKTGASHRIWRAPDTVSHVEGVDLIEPSFGDGETLVSLGARAVVEGFGHTVSANGHTYNEENDRVEEYAEDADTDAILQDPIIYGKTRTATGWDTDEVKVWEGARSGFRHLTAGDLDGNDVDDVVGGDASESPVPGQGDPGRVQAHNGTRNATDTVAQSIAYGNLIKDIAAPTRTHVSTISEDGVLMYTLDGWNNRHYYGFSPPSLDVLQFPLAQSIEFVNETHGWIVGEANSMARTTVGPHHWEDHDYDLYDPDGITELDLTEETLRYLDMEWQNGTHGVVVGGDCTSASLACEYGHIMYTEDGGDEWITADAPSRVDLNGFIYKDAHFPTEDTGYAVGSDGRIAKTTDGGEDWNLVSGDPWSSISDIVLRPDVEAVHFHDETTGLVAGEDKELYRTEDGGDSWEEVELQRFPGRSTNPDFQDMDFVDDEKGYLVGTDGAFYVTYDGGERWVADTPPGPDDTVAGFEYRAVEVPAEGTGWAGGSSDDAMSDRLLVSFPSHMKEAQAVSGTLDAIDDWHDNNDEGMSKVRSARVDPFAKNSPDTEVDYHLSNDGCTSWVEIPQKDPSKIDTFGLAEYEWTDFPDPSQTDLCFKAVLETEGRADTFHISPWIENITVEYEYQEDESDEWRTRNHTFHLDDPSVRDESATTALWNTTTGRVGLPYVDTFWTQRVDGSVQGVETADITGDLEKDVLAWTGRNNTDWDGDGIIGYDDRVYAFDGATGELLRNTSPLPGTPVSVHPISLPLATGDLVTDFVVSYENRDSGGANLRAYDGSSFDLIWNKSDNGTVASWAEGDIDDDNAGELVRGTRALFATEQPVVTVNHPDGGTPDWEWTLRPDFVGKYVFEYDVPRYALFGPHVVETTVKWDEIGGTGAQSARLYDYFSVTTPEGEIPENPVYRLDLVSKYEGAR